MSKSNVLYGPEEPCDAYNLNLRNLYRKFCTSSLASGKAVLFLLDLAPSVVRRSADKKADLMFESEKEGFDEMMMCLSH